MSVNAFDYIRDGAAIYRESFQIIRAEADLNGFSEDESRVVVRMIHACGMPDIAQHISFSPDFTDRAGKALACGAPILCDSMMVADGITTARLPQANQIICTLRAPGISQRAADIENTRSAAAVDLWQDRADGAVIVVGNAPTALYRVMEHVQAGRFRPAAIIGMPVGFVGAAESKQLLATGAFGAFAVIEGRRGGSALAASCVNALASREEV